MQRWLFCPFRFVQGTTKGKTRRNFHPFRSFYCVTIDIVVPTLTPGDERRPSLCLFTKNRLFVSVTSINGEVYLLQHL